MRILQICSARSLGGGERHVIDLAHALTRRGHNVYAALAPNSPLLSGLKALPAQNIVQLRMRNAFDIPSALQLARFIRASRAEIVHTHLARDYTLAAFAAQRNPGTQLIITRHVLFPLHRLQSLTLSRTARVIAVSHAVARTLHDSGIVSEGKITVIQNGIGLDRFIDASSEASTSRRREATTQLLVGAIGLLAPIKGHEDFLRAAALMAARRADVDFLIAGEDTSRTGEYRARLVRLIDELNLKNRVHLIGWVDDTAPLLRKLDIFVSASRVESFGLAMIEAMAGGVPVVATMSEGAQEIIDDGVTGKLVPIGDSEALANAIESLLDDADQREQLGTRARHAAREKFSLKRMVDATEQVYREALLSRRNDIG